MRELFVYYRVRSTQAPAARVAVLALQVDLRRQHPQLRARLLRRPDEQEGQQTWMETYATDPAQDPQGVGEALQNDIEARAAALSAFVQGARHVEVFIASDA
jgi:hypothetical protein